MNDCLNSEYPGMYALLNFDVRIEHVENSTELDSKHFTQYVIQVSTNLSVWEVYRRFADFVALRDILSRQFPQLSLPEVPVKTNARRHSHSAGTLSRGPSVHERKRKSLELFLRQLMTIDQIWISSAFIEFLDDSPAPSLGMQIQFTAVSKQVQHLRCGYLALERKLEKAEETISAAVGAIRELQLTQRSASVAATATTASSRKGSDLDSVVDGGGVATAAVVTTTSDRTVGAGAGVGIGVGASGLLPEFKMDSKVKVARPLSWRSLIRASNIGGVYSQGQGQGQGQERLGAGSPSTSSKTEVESWDGGEGLTTIDLSGLSNSDNLPADAYPLGDLRFYQRRPSNATLPGFIASPGASAAGGGAETGGAGASSLGGGVVGVLRSTSTDILADGDGDSDSMSDDSDAETCAVGAGTGRDSETSRGSFMGFSANSSPYPHSGFSSSNNSTKNNSNNNSNNMLPSYASIVEEEGSESESVCTSAPVSKQVSAAAPEEPVVPVVPTSTVSPAPSAPVVNAERPKSMRRQGSIMSLLWGSVDEDEAKKKPELELEPELELKLEPEPVEKVEIKENVLSATAVDTVSGAVTSAVTDLAMINSNEIEQSAAPEPEPEPEPEIVPPLYFSDGRVPLPEALVVSGQRKAFEQVLDMIHIANHSGRHGQGNGNGSNGLLTRSNAAVFLAKHMKKCVMAKALAVGNSTVLHCLLPDDPMDMTLILWKGSEATWHTSISDYFARLAGIAAAHMDQQGGWVAVNSNGLNGLNGPEEEPGEWEELYEDLCSTSLTLSRYASKIVDVSVSTPVSPGSALALVQSSVGSGVGSPGVPVAVEYSHEIVMTFDGLRINLVPNGRQQLCMTAFYEEFAELVGCDFLFKKTLVLLRAWWLYEAPLYGFGQATSALSDDALALMLCAVFNLHHKSITQPVQALAAFFAEYSDFDWANDAVSLQGPVKLVDLVNNGSGAVYKPISAHVVGGKVLSTYLNMYDSSRLAYSSAPRTGTPGSSTMNATTTTSTAAAASASVGVGVDGVVAVPLPGPGSGAPSPDEGGNSKVATAGNDLSVSVTAEANSSAGFTGGSGSGGGGQTGSFSPAPSPTLHTNTVSLSTATVTATMTSNLDDANPNPTSTTAVAVVVTEESKVPFSLGVINIVHPFSASSNMVSSALLLDGSAATATSHQQQQHQQQQIASDVINVFSIGAARFRHAMSKIAETENGNSQNSIAATISSASDSVTGFAGFVALSALFYPSLTGRYGDSYLKVATSSSALNSILNASDLATPTGQTQGAQSTRTHAALDGLGKIVRCPVIPSYATQQAWFQASPSLQESWNKIHYANLLLFGYVSDHALWALCVDVLQDRGFIPVGEIGKFLQELTGSVSMSGILKDKYGGLKKFLELHGPDFLISTNHPFNPNVYLKKALTAVEQESIERGETPASFLARYRKKSQKKKKSGAAVATPLDSPHARDVNGNLVVNNNNSSSSHSKIHKSSLSAPTPVVVIPSANTLSSNNINSNSASKATSKVNGGNTNNNTSNNSSSASKGMKQQGQGQGQGLGVGGRMNLSDVSSTTADVSFSQWQQQQQQQPQRSSPGASAGSGAGRESVYQQQQRARQQYEYQTKLAQEQQRRFLYGGAPSPRMISPLASSNSIANANSGHRGPAIYSQALPVVTTASASQQQQSSWQTASVGSGSITQQDLLHLGGGAGGGETQESVHSRRRSSYPMKQLAAELLDPHFLASAADNGSSYSPLQSPSHQSISQPQTPSQQVADFGLLQHSQSQNNLQHQQQQQHLSINGGGAPPPGLGGLFESLNSYQHHHHVSGGSGGNGGGAGSEQHYPLAVGGRYHGLLHSNQLGGQLMGGGGGGGGSNLYGGTSSSVVIGGGLGHGQGQKQEQGQQQLPLQQQWGLGLGGVLTGSNMNSSNNSNNVDVAGGRNSEAELTQLLQRQGRHFF